MEGIREEHPKSDIRCDQSKVWFSRWCRYLDHRDFPLFFSRTLLSPLIPNPELDLVPNQLVLNQLFLIHIFRSRSNNWDLVTRNKETQHKSSLYSSRIHNSYVAVQRKKGDPIRFLYAHPNLLSSSYYLLDALDLWANGTIAILFFKNLSRLLWWGQPVTVIIIWPQDLSILLIS